MTTTTETALASLGLTGEEIRAILNRAEIRAFPRDVVIVKEGDRSNSLYVILEGRVKTFVVDPAGKEAVLAIKTGRCFGGKGLTRAAGCIMTVGPRRFSSPEE
jgi:CRP-like cAMP-binding protein